MAVSVEQTDPRDLLPEDFVETWGGDTVAEAFKIAERAPSSTPKDEMKRCPDCGAVRVRYKPGGWKNIPGRKNSAYKCNTCRSHFDDPAPTIADVREDLRDELPEAAERAGRLAVVLGGVDQ